MGTPEVPDFLTIDEAARVLRIGRTAGYQQANCWINSEGREGLPVRKVGGLLRVPRAQFEDHYDIRITGIPDRDTHRRGPARAKGGGPRPNQDIPRKPATSRRRRGDGDAAQDGLPFAG